MQTLGKLGQSDTIALLVAHSSLQECAKLEVKGCFYMSMLPKTIFVVVLGH